MKKLVFVFIGIAAVCCPAGTISQNWSSTTGWTPYTGSGSNGSTVTMQPDGNPYLKTALHRSSSTNGRALVYTSLGDDAVGAVGVSGMPDNIWMQCDIAWTSGTGTSNNTMFGIFNSAGDNDNDPAYNFAGVNMGGGSSDNLTLQVLGPAGAGQTFGSGGGNTVTDRIKLHFYKSGGQILVDGAAYTINNTTGVISSTPLFAVNGLVFMNSTATLSMGFDSFGVKNTIGGDRYNGYKFDNMYFSTNSAASNTPLPFWIPEPATVILLSLGTLITRKK